MTHTNVVQSEEATREDVSAHWILTIHPPEGRLNYDLVRSLPPSLSLITHSLSLSLSLSLSPPRKNFHAPVEVQDELLKASSEELIVPLSLRGGHLVYSKHGPGVHRRIDIIEGKLIGRDLPIRSHVPLPQEENKLVFSELWVNFGKRDHVEGQVPGGILEEQIKDTKNRTVRVDLQYTNSNATLIVIQRRRMVATPTQLNDRTTQ